MPAERNSRLATALLLGTLLTPLLFVPGFVYPAVVPRTIYFNVVVELAALLLVAGLLTRGARPGVGRDYFLLALAAFVGIQLLAALFGVAPLRSVFSEFERMWGVFTWVHLLLFYVLVRSFLGEDGRRVYLRLALVVVAIAGVVMLAGNAAMDRGMDWFGSRARNAGTLGNEGFMAALLLFGSAVALLVWKGDRSRGWRTAGAVIGLFAAVLFLYVSKRAAVIGVLGGLGVALLAVALVRRGRTRRLAAGLMVAGAVAVLALVAGALASGADGQSGPRFVAQWHAGSLQRAAAERLVYWDAALDAFRARPLLGYGPENFDVAFGAQFDPADQRTLQGLGTYPDRAHNAFLDVLALTGVPGLLAFLGMWAALGWHLLSGYRRGALPGWDATVILALAVAYALFLGLWFPEINSFPLFLALAAFVVTRAEGPLVRLPEEAAAGRRRLAPLAAAAVVVALVTWQHAVRPLQAARAVASTAEGGFEQRLDGFRRAFALEPPQREDALALYVAMLQAQRPLAAEIRRDPRSAGEYDQAVRVGIHHLSHAIQRNPTSDYLHALGAAVGEAGFAVLDDPSYADFAVQEYRRAIAAAPGRIRHRHALAALHLARGEHERAAEQIEEVLRQYDAFGETHFFMAIARHGAGELEEAQEWMSRSLAMNYRFVSLEPYLALARSLEAAGQADRAAALYSDYLAVGDRTEGGSSGMRTWREAEMRIGNRLAPLYLRIGRPEAAAALADALALQLPVAAAQYGTFAADVRSGVDRGWSELETLIPDRDLAALRAFTPAGS